MELKPHNIGFVSTRFRGHDGVSLEAEKWLEILGRLGYRCFLFGGDCDEDEMSYSYLVPEAHFAHPDIQEIHTASFSLPHRPPRITRRIHLLEDPHSVPAILAALDVCVFPVLEPGMPTTLLEAAVLGRPIVASAVPGIGDLFVDGRQISIVPPDDPKALAAAIARLLDEPALAAEMASRAQRHALDYLSAEASVQRHLELYERLLSGESASGATTAGGEAEAAASGDAAAPATVEAAEADANGQG